MQTALNCGGIVLDLRSPKVMGILNITPDSFYDGGSCLELPDQLRRVEQMLAEGAAIIDIGAVSTRPGSVPVSEREELDRLLPALNEIKKRFPDTIISVDTFRSLVARAAIENGAGMINDIYGGRFDSGMFDSIQSSSVAYIMMHMLGKPFTMQAAPQYDHVVEEVMDFFREQTGKFTNDFRQIIIDPGFGFGKTVEHNYQLLKNLSSFQSLGFPVMVGLSRKSMINRILQTEPSEALNGTTILNTIALLNGADILRVHDVKEAVQAVSLVSCLHKSSG